MSNGYRLFLPHSLKTSVLCLLTSVVVNKKSTRILIHLKDCLRLSFYKQTYTYTHTHTCVCVYIYFWLLLRFFLSFSFRSFILISLHVDLSSFFLFEIACTFELESLGKLWQNSCESREDYEKDITKKGAIRFRRCGREKQKIETCHQDQMLRKGAVTCVCVCVCVCC